MQTIVYILHNIWTTELYIELTTPLTDVKKYNFTILLLKHVHFLWSQQKQQPT